MVRAARAESGEPRMLGGGQEVEDDLVIREVPDLRAVGRRDRPQVRCQRRRLRPALGRVERLVAVDRLAERMRRGRSLAMYSAAVSMIHSEFASASSDVSPHAVMP